MPDETPKDLRPITVKDYERTELPASERQYYEKYYNIKPRSSLSEYYLTGANVNLLDELTNKYNMREAAKYPGFFSADSEKFASGGIASLPGVRQGPAPLSGPLPDGLPFVPNRVTKI